MSAELEELSAAMQRVAVDCMDTAVDVAKEAGKEARDTWRDQWRGFKSAKHLYRAVTHDVFTFGDQVMIEVGPDKRRKQGPLGNLLEYGSVNNAPRPGGPIAQARTSPLITRLLADRGEKLLG